MHLDALQTMNVALYNIEVQGDFLKANLTVLNDADLRGQVKSLGQPLNIQGDRYTIAIPQDLSIGLNLDVTFQIYEHP